MLQKSYTPPTPPITTVVVVTRGQICPSVYNCFHQKIEKRGGIVRITRHFLPVNWLPSSSSRVSRVRSARSTGMAPARRDDINITDINDITTKHQHKTLTSTTSTTATKSINTKYQHQRHQQKTTARNSSHGGGNSSSPAICPSVDSTTK